MGAGQYMHVYDLKQEKFVKIKTEKFVKKKHKFVKKKQTNL